MTKEKKAYEIIKAIVSRDRSRLLSVTLIDSTGVPIRVGSKENVEQLINALYKMVIAE